MADKKMIMAVVVIMVVAIAALFIIFKANASEPVVFDLSTVRLRVMDGDTFKINGHPPYRMYGFDAPEKRQVCKKYGLPVDCAGAATSKLKELLSTGKLSCTQKGVSFNRIVMHCSVDDTDIGIEMVRNGFAVHAPRYTSGLYEGRMVLAQIYARINLLGVWDLDEFERPDDWRKRQRSQ